MNKQTKWLVGLAIGLLLCVCVAAGVLIMGRGLAYFGLQRTAVGIPTTVPTLSAAPDIPLTTASLQATSTNLPATLPVPSETPSLSLAEQTQAVQDAAVIQDMDVPVADLRDLATRLEGKTDIPETLPAPAQPFQVGAQQQFWGFNADSRQSFPLKATLRYVTEHLYFWIQDGVGYSQSDLKKLADTFESKIYPTDRAFFGSEWTPGIDNDPHLYAVYARNLGSHVGGFYSMEDEYPPQVRTDSNAHELFFINADGVKLGDEYIYSTMAHEFQHMIHWNQDRNEDAWINEGFSMLAQLLNGYVIGGSDTRYIKNPDLQLNTWESAPDAVPHYGESFLFLTYFLDRFGEKVTQALVSEPKNGLEGIDAVMNRLNITDPLTGQGIRAEDIFTDWTLASFLNDPQVGDGRYAYKQYTKAPHAVETERVNTCPTDWLKRTVHQYGVDYIGISCSGDFTLEWQGTPEVGIMPVNPSSGQFDFWSNEGDDSDMTLTHAFDFSQAKGPLTLVYRTWFDLEQDYDYVYLVASEDGQHWKILQTPSSTNQNPSGNNFGWGYTGKSAGWIEENVNLSQFAGKKVQLRFEYITDPAVNGEGFLLDDVRIPEINYSTNFETDEGGWQGQGFVRIANTLPQTYRVSLIMKGQKTTVQYLQVQADGTIRIPLHIATGSEETVLVVSGVTRFTHQEASYQFRLIP